MPSLLKDTIHRSLVESLYNEIINRTSNYYYFIGRVKPWDDESEAPSPENLLSYETETRNNIISVKKINIKDVSFVVNRVNWTSGTTYDQYDPEYSVSTPSYSGAVSLKFANFYVLTSTFGVYKCIFNNNNGASTVEPFALDFSPVTYADGYVWKYMYTIPLSTRNRFLTDLYMPVQRSVNNIFYSNGEINSVIVDNTGSGYAANLATTISVIGTFKGGSGNVQANLVPIISSNRIATVLIENGGNNYANVRLEVNDYSGQGTSYYKNVANVKIFNPGLGYNSAVRANTVVRVITTGVFQPNSNAILTPIYSSNTLSNSIVDFLIVDPGEGYIQNAQTNTTITISTTGAFQPSANASANIFFNNKASITPVLRNGVIDRVYVSDPGDRLSSNITTTIAVSGDGEGASLSPVINQAGQLVDVIINNRGFGYSYVNLTVTGPGTGANVYADLSTGDLESLQSLVELSAINGGVHALRVDDAGNNYSNANVTLVGDGSGFVGNVVTLSNSISLVEVVSPGSGYTYANVLVTGPGSNANVSAIFSPFNGHGSDAVAELFADTIMFYNTLANETIHGKSVDNQYRQIGIVKNPKKFDSEESFTSSTGTSCYLVTLNSTSGISQDDLLYVDLLSDRYFEVVGIYGNQVLIISKNNYELQSSDILKSLSTNYSISSIDEYPDINIFTGDLLYIDNKTSVTYSSQQSVTLRTILRL